MKHLDYGRVLTLLSRRYVGQEDACCCRECGMDHGEHKEGCDCWYYAKRILRRALREAARK